LSSSEQNTKGATVHRSREYVEDHLGRVRRAPLLMFRQFIFQTTLFGYY